MPQQVIAIDSRNPRTIPQQQPDNLTPEAYALLDLSDLAEYIRHSNAPFAYDAMRESELNRAS